MDPLESVSAQELVAQYANESRRRGEALGRDDVSEATDHAIALWDISAELRRRREERLLLPLLQDDDPWIRFSAGTDALSIAAEEGQAALSELIGVLDDYPLGPRVMLELWREGRLPSP